MSADESITSLPDAVAALGALPMPVGPQMPPFPPAPETFEEKLRADVARLQGLLAEAVADKHRALRERDDMRERVSEPYGCQYCGITKRSHGRRWITGAGYHAWTAPTQEQIAERMKARRTVRLASRVKTLARLRDRVDEVERMYTFDTAELKRRVAELKAELLTANGALDDVARARRDSCPCAADRPHQVGCPKDGVPVASPSFAERAARESDPGRRAAWRMLAEREPEFHSSLHHDYRVGHDLPEMGGA